MPPSRPPCSFIAAKEQLSRPGRQTGMPWPYVASRPEPRVRPAAAGRGRSRLRCPRPPVYRLQPAGRGRSFARWQTSSTTNGRTRTDRQTDRHTKSKSNQGLNERTRDRRERRERQKQEDQEQEGGPQAPGPREHPGVEGEREGQGGKAGEFPTIGFHPACLLCFPLIPIQQGTDRRRSVENFD